MINYVNKADMEVWKWLNFLAVLMALSLMSFDVSIATTANSTESIELYGNDTTVQPVFSVDENATLIKCFCGANQVWDGLKCKYQSAYIRVLSREQEELAVASDAFKNVKISPVQCPENLLLVNLMDNNLFNLLPSGDLYWLENKRVYKQYCTEHMIDENEQVYWAAQICLEPPSVPQCCPQGFALTANDTCVPHEHGVFALPLHFNSIRTKQVALEGDVEQVTCSGISVSHHIDLNGNDMYPLLEYMVVYGKPLLVWMPSESVIPKEEFQYCIAIEDKTDLVPSYIAKVCYTSQSVEHLYKCSNASCVRKCCPQGHLLSEGACAVAHSEEEYWEPIFHFKKNLTAGAEPPDNLTFIEGLPICGKGIFNLKPDEIESDPYYLLDDGSLHVPGHYKTFPPDQYCLDLSVQKTGIIQQAIICAPEESEKCEWKNLLYLVLLSISCIFLAATLCVYLGVAELRDRTNGRCLISMTSAMLAAYITLIINREVIENSDVQCIATGFFGHVCSLATFFWLNVMCYDMWSTLRSSHQQHQSFKRFIGYSIYAWGCPLLIGLITVIIDILEPTNVIRPNFNFGNCWFYGTAEFWLYLSGIILILVVINLFFFVHVSLILSRKLQQRQTFFDTGTSQRSNNTNRNKEQVWLYIKLSIVMGVSWIAEGFGGLHRTTCGGFWVVVDIINALQGVFIFAVAVCNKDNIKKVQSAWQPRIKSVRSKFSTMRGTSPNNAERKQKYLTGQSVASETSRKTSVTSLPRKMSTISTTSTPLKSQKTMDFGTTSEETSFRKISTASNDELMRLETLSE